MKSDFIVSYMLIGKLEEGGEGGAMFGKCVTFSQTIKGETI